MKKILVISTASTHFKALLPYCNALRQNFAVEFLFDDRHNVLHDQVIVCQNLGYAHHLFNDLTNSKNRTETKFDPNFFQKIYYTILKFLPKFQWRAAVKAIKAETKNCTKLLNKIKPTIIFSAEDNTGIVAIMNKAASDLKIKTIVTPFTLSNHEELCYVFSKMPGYKVQSFKQRMIFSIYKKWKTHYKDFQMSCELPEQVLAKELTGVAPLNPWISIGGRSETILLENDFVKDYYVKSGLKSADIKICGHPSYRNINERLQNKTKYIKEITEEYKIPNEKPIVLCSLPPDQIENENFKTYEELAEFWCKTLSNVKSHQVWISLHPRAEYDKMKFIENYGVRIIRKPIEEIIPLCDIYVACISATIRLALTCNKAVLNFDVFNMNYSEYTEIAPVITVKTKQDLESEYKKLCEGNYNANFKAFYEAKKNYFGNLNEDCETKIVSTFKQLC